MRSFKTIDAISFFPGVNLEAGRVHGHPFHIVRPSRWPFVVAVSLATTMFCAVFYRHGMVRRNWWWYGIKRIFVVCVFRIMYWGLDVHIEGAVEGCHTKRVQRNLLFGFALFIISEVSLFRSFFWAFGHLSTNPSIFIGETWPPFGIQPLDPFSFPLTNTVLLLASGVLVTCVHYIFDDATTKGKVLLQSWRQVRLKEHDLIKFDRFYRFFERCDCFAIVEMFCENYAFCDVDEAYYDLWSRRFALEFVEVEGEIVDEFLIELAEEVVAAEVCGLEELLEDESSSDIEVEEAEFGFWVSMVDILNKYNDNVVLALVGALVYGLLFTAYQVYEYIHATFDISDSVYGSTFYRLTGLHGLHVLVGTFLLAIQLARFIYGAVFADRAVGLTTRIWYWHFVDVVWLVVFAVVYIWGSWGVIAVEDIMSAQAAERLVPSYKDVWCS